MLMGMFYTRKALKNMKSISTIWCSVLLGVIILSHGLAAQAKEVQTIPQSVEISLRKNGIPKDAISISVVEIQPGLSGKFMGKAVSDWRGNIPMNPASTMKLVTTLVGLDILGPHYRWRTSIYTDGKIAHGVLKGDLYLQGTGDPKLIPEEMVKLMDALQKLGIQKIDGNLIFDRSAYAPEVMEQSTIDGESQRAYNVAPDPLLYAFRTLSFVLSHHRNKHVSELTYTPALLNFQIKNQLQARKQDCNSWRQDIRFEITPEPDSGNASQKLAAQFSGTFPNGCKEAKYNIVALDANTFLTRGFAAAWELAGGKWAKAPSGISGTVPSNAKLLLHFKGIDLENNVQDINKFSNNVMARQILLTLALEKKGKPATIENGILVIREQLSQLGLNFPELVIENGSGLSRNETISALHLNQLLVTARQLAIAEPFYNSLPIAGIDGTMKHRLTTHLRQFLHLKKKPEVRIKTGSLNDVRSIAGYVVSKSGKMYAVSSFINHPNAKRGLEVHDQLLLWVLEDGPDPTHAR